VESPPVESPEERKEAVSATLDSAGSKRSKNKKKDKDQEELEEAESPG